MPVVVDGDLVGIITRADLVRAFHRADEEIRREIAEDVLLRTLWISPGDVTIAVEQGEVSLGGELDNRSGAEIAVAYVRRVTGVTGDARDLRTSQAPRSHDSLLACPRHGGELT